MYLVVSSEISQDYNLVWNNCYNCLIRTSVLMILVWYGVPTELYKGLIIECMDKSFFDKIHIYNKLFASSICQSVPNSPLVEAILHLVHDRLRGVQQSEEGTHVSIK